MISVPDDQVRYHISGLTDTNFPSSRPEHYAELLKFARHPEMYDCSASAMTDIKQAISAFADAGVIKSGTVRYETWKANMKAGHTGLP